VTDSRNGWFTDANGLPESNQTLKAVMPAAITGDESFPFCVSRFIGNLTLAND
jgi:hypothetical protein